MTISELQILFDINKGNELDVLKKHAYWTRHGYFFVDSENGQCYLFDENGRMDDVKKITILLDEYVKKDIKKIVIPKGVKCIGDYAFINCTSLTNIKIPESADSIRYCAFYNCTSLKSIEISNGIESIGTYAFWNCTSLTSIEIPESVKSIGDWAFASCTSLTSVEIPNSIESIGDEAFVDCESLTSIIFKNKTIDQVKAMDNYPWGIEDESIIKCS